MDRKKWIEEVVDEMGDGEVLTADGMDDAIIGLWITSPNGPVVVYSIEKCIQVFMKRDEMCYEDACDFFEYNVAGSHVGPRTPIYISTPEEE